MKITLLERGPIRCVITILCTSLFPIPQAMKIPYAKAAVDKEWEKFEKLHAWQVTKVRSKREVLDKVPKEGRTDHFATLMNLCQLKNSELEQQFQ